MSREASPDLYSLGVLARATEGGASAERLREAFTEIERFGRRPGFGRGHRQWLHFMALVRLYGALASRRDTGAGLEHDFTAFCEADPPLPGLVLVMENTTLLEAAFGRSASVHDVHDVIPGRYTLALDTGRVLWDGRLETGQLRRRLALPGRALPAAADSADQAAPARWSLSETLLDGLVLLRVFPGVERGRIQIRMRGAGREMTS